MTTKEIEAAIAQHLIKLCLDRGYTLGVNDGEETTLTLSTDDAAIFDALRTTDMDRLLIYDAMNERIGSVLLIWGNGYDLISDNSDNEATNAVVEEALAFADTHAEAFVAETL